MLSTKASALTAVLVQMFALSAHLFLLKQVTTCGDVAGKYFLV
jgi:hypothetical protein